LLERRNLELIGLEKEIGKERNKIAYELANANTLSKEYDHKLSNLKAERAKDQYI